MKTYSILICFLISITAIAQEKSVELLKENAFPEGLAYSKKFKTLYIGSMMTGNLFSAVNDAQVFNELPIPNRTENVPSLGMKEENGNLYVATGTHGTIEVFNIPTQKKLYSYKVPEGLPKDQIFINDVAIDGGEKGYVTDSFRPVIYSFQPNSDKSGLEVWLDLKNTPIDFQEGYNLNGIVLTKKANYLLVVQTNTGKLFRIETATKKITEVKLGGDPLLYGDGLSLYRNNLYVALNVNGAVAKVELNEDFSEGKVTIIKKGFQFPTAVAVTGKKLYVLNSKLDKAGENAEVKEFKVNVLTEF